ncbi:hypothetical protein CEXT_244631 [Caerostris extrusa]|uniref:Uncharacterized protein n=1 Tax=Caerostris extrusa TaxID=172846 RepID=A0AAV4N8M1_CAEEX|nr:hypothetical protein CEXT_244631 [Caerostris extrusa]
MFSTDRWGGYLLSKMSALNLSVILKKNPEAFQASKLDERHKRSPVYSFLKTSTAMQGNKYSPLTLSLACNTIELSFIHMRYNTMSQ